MQTVKIWHQIIWNRIKQCNSLQAKQAAHTRQSKSENEVTIHSFNKSKPKQFKIETDISMYI